MVTVLFFPYIHLILAVHSLIILVASGRVEKCLLVHAGAICLFSRLLFGILDKEEKGVVD